MKFDDVVDSIPTIHALKRTASAHVVDYAHLGSDELRSNIRRVRNQFTHPESVEASLSQIFFQSDDIHLRTLAPLIVKDILLNEHGYMLPIMELQERLLEIEQSIVDRSNEEDLEDICGTGGDSTHYKNLSLYYFVLETAWKHRDTKSVDEANLLRKLRTRLRITERESRFLEAMLGKYPKPRNELHNREEITDCLRELESLGIVFEVRDQTGEDLAVIPEEVAAVVRDTLGVEIRRPGYVELLQDKRVRLKAYLKEALDTAGVPYPDRVTREKLQQRVGDTVPPSVLLGGNSPRGGLNSKTLSDWCSDLGLSSSGTKTEKIQRLIEHYDQLQFRAAEEEDERQRLYHFYEELAHRDTTTLRSQHLIEKDVDVERNFESATNYLFEVKLNHTPLRQAGSEHSDGRLSFRDGYVLWDNKSSETPVSLKSHLTQFDSYVGKADKPVPIFLVIAPAFTDDSEAVALRYTAEHIGVNIALITAGDLKQLAELWASEDHDGRSEPFPLGLFARTGRLPIAPVRASLGL
ncbi:MAG: SAP domain-containing protein [Planctomycetota bacterium]